MGRDHARIQLAIWRDDDWTALDVNAQHAYWLLLTQPRLSYCGVLDYFPGRLATLADGLTQAKVKAAIRQLERARYIVVDRDTQELLIRTYVRHDGVLDRVNMGKAVGRAIEKVTSKAIRVAIGTELGRLLHENNSLQGWIGLRAESPMAFEMASAMASTMESEM